MRTFTAISILALALFGSACASSDKSADQSSTEGRVLGIEVDDAVKRFQSRDPSMSKFFDGSHGYAVFPAVGKGAVGIGGAHGDGQVFEKGKLVGVSVLSQVTIGFQLGGQEYSEIIFFENQETFENFTKGNFELAAQASAVAAKAGAATNVNYEHGVAIFSMTTAGLMFEASVGGQKFDYKPITN